MIITLHPQPFRTPDYVIIKQDGHDDISIRISDVDEQTLSDLCDVFRQELFDKVGKKDPREQPK